MPPTSHTYRACPACGKKKAVGDSMLVAFDDSHEVSIGCRRCTACGAESIRGVVVRSKTVRYRTNAAANTEVVRSIREGANWKRRRAQSITAEADMDDVLANTLETPP